MPIESKAQQGFMFAHKDDSGPTGVAARDFIAAGPKGGSYSSLPEKVGKEQNKKAGSILKHSFQGLINKSRRK